MSYMAIEAVQAHIEDLHREAEHRRRVTALRRSMRASRLLTPRLPERTFWQVRRVLAHR
jgi:hypothetical protein